MRAPPQSKALANLSAPLPILFFASAAHAMNHILLALYFTLVLVVSHEWAHDYASLIALWAPGAMLLGLGAPFAGWLGGRIGETRVMVLCFLGLGLASIACGFAQSPAALGIALGFLGLSGSIYHPVALPWVVKHAARRGKAIASTGIAGSIGVALGPVIAGLFATLWGWRSAFIVPGTVTAALGLVLLFYYVTGRVTDRDGDAHQHHAPPTRRDTTRAFAALGVTMTLAFIASSAFGTAVPKIVQSQPAFAPYSLLVIGLIAGAIQLLGAGAQFAGGHMGDKGNARMAYAGGFVMLTLTYPMVALFSDWGMAIAAVIVVFFFEWTAPLETLFLARYTPEGQRGLIFGVRYGLAAIGTPAGVWLIARLYDPDAGFRYLMMALSALAASAAIAAWFLPSESLHKAPLPAE